MFNKWILEFLEILVSRIGNLDIVYLPHQKLNLQIVLSCLTALVGGLALL